MPYYIHVNRHVIDSNRKHKRNDPPITIRKGKRGKSVYAFEIEFEGKNRMIYEPHTPILPCGARLVTISEKPPRIIR